MEPNRTLISLLKEKDYAKALEKDIKYVCQTCDKKGKLLLNPHCV
jgi:hypothetical protein